MNVSTQVEQNKPHDARWFDRLAEINSNVLRNLAITPSTLKRVEGLVRSRAGEVLPLAYAHAQKFEVDARIAAATQLSEEVAKADTVHPMVQSLYTAKLEERLLELHLIKQLQHAHGSLDVRGIPHVAQELVHRLYGQPVPAIFALTLAELRYRLERRGAASALVAAGIAGFVGELPPFAELAKVYPRVRFASASLRQGEDIKSVEGLRAYLVAELDRVGLGDTWRVRVDERGHYHHVTVFYESRVVMLPSQKVFSLSGRSYVLSWRKAQKLVAHEILTHVLRSARGARSGLLLLSRGLDQYMRGEEGIATFREQKLSATNRYFAGFESYLAIGLAYGLDRQGERRTMEELYATLFPLFRAQAANSDAAAHAHTWKRVVRTYRGSTSSVGNVIFTKDLVYRHGNMAIHELLSTTPEREAEFDVGMYDPTNKRHVAALRELNILPPGA